MNSSDRYSFKEAQDYWKYAPSGSGKIDTSKLIRLNDEDFKKAVYPHHRSRYYYFWEDVSILNKFAEDFKGKNVLAIGTGIGHDEIPFMKAGAKVTCTDIVESNLKVIERIAKLEGVTNLSTILINDIENPNYPDVYDVIYARGCLHQMPFDMTKQYIELLKGHLKRDGVIVVSFYTHEFVQQTTKDDDPTVFAIASDPSVDGSDNPWSEWYDLDKTRRLFGEDMYIKSIQKLVHFARNNYYVAAFANELDEIPEPKEIVDLDGFENDLNEPIHSLNIHNYYVGDATISKNDDDSLLIATGSNQFGYAYISEKIITSNFEAMPNKVSIDLDVLHGGASLGILDVEKDTFVLSKVLPAIGRRKEYFYLETSILPPVIRIIVSNYQQTEPGPSQFKLYGVDLLRTRIPLHELKPHGLDFSYRDQ